MKAALLAVLAVLAVSSVKCPAQVAPEFEKRPRIKSLDIKAEGPCLDAMKVLRQELQSFPYPEDWVFAVACNRGVWQKAQRFADLPTSYGAFTSLGQKVTVVDAEMLRQLRPVYRKVLAHELGHIRCNCKDESVANREANKILESIQ